MRLREWTAACVQRHQGPVLGRTHLGAPGPPCSSSWNWSPLLHSSLDTQMKHPLTRHVPARGHGCILGGPTMPLPAWSMGRARWGHSAGLKHTQRHSANMPQHVTEGPSVSPLLTVTTQSEGPVLAAASAVPCSGVSTHAAPREAPPSSAR